MSGAPRTRADLEQERVAACLRSAAEDPAQARLWLEKARRISPDDPSVILAFAQHLLFQGDPAAADLFSALAGLTDMREAWLGLAAAAWRYGSTERAAAALGRVLCSHVLPDTPELLRLASEVARDAGLPGWCGVVATPDRTLILRFGGIHRPDLLRDGVPWQGRRPGKASLLVASDRGSSLLGSPIDLARIRRVEGCVGEAEGGLAGWAWHPADPDTDPTIILRRGRAIRRLIASDHGMIAPRPLTRPRRFSLAASELPEGDGPISVMGADGRHLLGSPLDPQSTIRVAAAIAHAAARPRQTDLALAASPARLRGAKRQVPCLPARPVAIVIPVFAQYNWTRDCLASVLASASYARLIVVDDATPEPAIAALLDRLAVEERITLLRHDRNQGFPASANAGMRAALALQPAHDVLLLNSDTLVPASSWLDRLHHALHAHDDIGSVTPLSNDATILSYPARDQRNDPPEGDALTRLDALAARVNGSDLQEIPTGVGFCLLLRHECLREVGLFRPELFAQGYGEENDLCLRARHLGWRHMAASSVMIAHRGGASFGHASQPLITRNLALLERLYPGYHDLIEAHRRRHPSQDVLAQARRRLDAARWRDTDHQSSVILITHDSQGGVERVIRARCAALHADGHRAIVLRPVLDPDSTEAESLPGLCQVSDGPDPTHPNLIYRLPEELDQLAALLRPDGPAEIELHHRLGHDPSVTELAERLAIPTTLHLHDYALFCPRITLVGPDRRYCGEPEQVSACEACIADAGSRLEESISIQALRIRSWDELASARQIVVPSQDMALRLRRHFPGVAPRVMPLEDDALWPAVPPPTPSRTRLVCVIGAIGVEKGYDTLLACARDAAQRDLGLRFVLAGHSIDDDRLLATGRVFITGRYRETDAVALVRSVGADLAFLPSLWPETWGFTLGLAWQAGLRAAVFDIGAMPARVRATGLGWVLPLGMPPSAVNTWMLGGQ
jgi:GT2 family glycosyltransferase/glycosyltransferase involved in cell wall biosynthesis